MAPMRIPMSVRTGSMAPSSNAMVMSPAPQPTRPQAETRSLSLKRRYGLTVVIVLSMSPDSPASIPGLSKLPSPSLKPVFDTCACMLA